MPVPTHLASASRLPGRTTRRALPCLAGAVAIAALVVTGACEDPVPPPPGPASITLNPATLEFTDTGDTARITAVAVDEHGDTLTGYAVEWATSDTRVATVSRTGLVGAVGPGTARITAKAGEVSAAATVTVVIDVERKALVALYEATGGEGWGNREGWLSDAPLSDWYGVGTNSGGEVEVLQLRFNRLLGSLPPEIGDLAQLRELDLRFNDLIGSIPPEIGNLAALRELHLHYNDLSGSIPPGMGNLTELRELWLHFNNLSGSIPAELGSLDNLLELRLHDNAFTGPIPAELGSLDNLLELRLHNNAFTGPIPAELGNLAQLADMWLGGNDLSGPFPVWLTRLENLEVLMLAGNPHTGMLPEEIGDMARLASLLLTDSGLSGLLPATMTRLRGLSVLMLGGTGLCAPDDDDFRAWLNGVPKRRIPSCEDLGEGSAAYLAQAAQSREYPVPLVAGEKALLRVFVVAPAAAGDTIPLVRTTFYLDGEVEEVVEIEPGSSLIGKEVNEGSLNASANAEVPASVIQPGLEMVVEIDPDGTMDEELGVKQRIPETGRKAVKVRRMPDLGFTLIPFLWSEDPDSAILDVTEDLSADDELLWAINTLLPVADIDLEIHDPVVSTSNGAFSLLHQTSAIRAAENGTGFFMGTMSGPVTGALGVAYAPGWASFSLPDSSVMAHELGHNMSLSHAPCGGAGGPDPSFPQSDGSIGAWGYDFDSGELVDPSIRDLMSYCDPTWISEFYFTNSLRYRLAVETEERRARQAAPAPSLLIWGGVGPDGVPYLEPAFVIDAEPSLPRAGGSHRLTGATEDGAELFMLDFDMPVVADAEGRGSFAFTLPVQAGWEDDLARITLSGPGGSFILDKDSDRPAAIVRDPRTGKVRGILTDAPHGATAADILGGHDFEPGLEVFLSRGIPDAAAWRR